MEKRTFGYADSRIGYSIGKCRISCRIGEGDLNTELLTARIKGFK